MSESADQQLEGSVAEMLRAGVTLAAVIVAIGGLMLLRTTWSTVPNYRHFHAESAALRTLPGIVRDAAHLSPTGVIEFGLLVLIATPVARVVLCVVGFARQRDKLYVGVSLVVLCVLLYSLLKGTM